MKRFLLCMSLFFSWGCLQNLMAEDLDVLVVELKSDISYKFSLNEPPRFSLNNGQMEVVGDVETSFEVSNVRQIYFAPSASVGVSKTEAKSDVTLFYEDNSHVRVEGVQPGSVAYLYAADGKLLGEKTASGNAVEVQLPNEAGIYMLQVNGRTFKVRKR